MPLGSSSALPEGPRVVYHGPMTPLEALLEELNLYLSAYLEEEAWETVHATAAASQLARETLTGRERDQEAWDAFLSACEEKRRSSALQEESDVWEDAILSAESVLETLGAVE